MIQLPPAMRRALVALWSTQALRRPLLQTMSIRLPMHIYHLITFAFIYSTLRSSRLASFSPAWRFSRICHMHFPSPTVVAIDTTTRYTCVSHGSYQKKNLPWPQLLLCGPPPRSTRDHSPAPPLLSPATQHRSTLRWRVLIQLQPPLPRSAPPVALQRGLCLIKQGVLDISIMPIPLYASHMLDLHLLAIQTPGYKVI